MQVGGFGTNQSQIFQSIMYLKKRFGSSLSCRTPPPSSAMRVSRTAFSSGVNMVLFSGKGTIQKMEQKLKMTVMRPSIMNILHGKWVSVRLHSQSLFSGDLLPPPSCVVAHAVHL